MTLGFVVGKFYPPHRGHKHLIDTARRQVDRLVVLLPHHVTQKIPGEVRKRWLEEIHPDCEIHLVPDELENDSEQWAKFTREYLGRSPDVVFTSEDYGPGFAEHLGCRHVMVDRLRQTVPVSGTLVRREPLSHLDFLEPCVRAWFVRRVVLSGAESTGKTTLAALLAREFETAWVPEYGREYWEAKVAGLSMDGPLPGWSSEEFVTIASRQQQREELAARSANKVLICDTNAFATGLWHERYLGHRDERVDAIGRADSVALYLLCEPDFPFVQDGWRDGERIRDWMHGRFVEELAKTGVETVRLRGPLEARVREAKRAIEAVLRKPFDL
ncbi:AAA family ATPase [Hyalangium gracile]|uniref:AAA family ATPase n=1 Tax=Hyalangium gracile TaxID=394092 RepID=UPI001CCB1B82|nr:AAA family ATPase [Hyalangium gracile]